MKQIPFMIDLTRSSGEYPGGHVKTYTYSEARQNLASLLDEARLKGGVRIRRRDGASFVLRAETTTSAPLAVGGAKLGLKRSQIVAAIRDSRRRK